MALFNVDVTTVVKLGKDAEGRLSVTGVGCDAKLEDLNLQLHGAARYRREEEAQTDKQGGRGCSCVRTVFVFCVERWIYQPIVNHHHGEIKAVIQEKVSVSILITQELNALFDTISRCSADTCCEAFLAINRFVSCCFAPTDLSCCEQVNRKD